MGISFLISFALFASCIASVAAQNTSGFDHFWLVQSWPPVYCQKYPCRNPPFDFVLHGLWPVNSSGHTLKNSRRTLDFKKTLGNSSLERELEKHWPSLSLSDSAGFWKHEWEEHGSGQPLMEAPEYFQAAIRLRKSVDLMGTLKRQGIFPNGMDYPTSDFVDATKDIYGYPRLTCAYRFLLNEVNLCVDRQARNFISCNHKERGSGTCGKKINFPRKVKIDNGYIWNNV